MVSNHLLEIDDDEILPIEITDVKEYTHSALFLFVNCGFLSKYKDDLYKMT